MITRTLTGTVILPNGSALATGTLTLTPINPLPADEDGLLAPVREEYPIVDGALSGTLQAPAHYVVTLVTDKPVLSFTAHVSESDTPITFSTLYASRYSSVEVSKTVLELVTEAIIAHEASADPHAQYLQEGEGSGDMMTATYDPDEDGKVVSAEAADIVPWTGITDKPATFAPDAHDHDADYAPISHTHDDRYYAKTEIDASLAGKSDSGHVHDDRYYTESELDALLSGKSDTGHNHDAEYSDIAHEHPEATSAVAGYLSAADKEKLDGIESGATDDQTGAEIVAAFTAEVPVATQAEIEAGTLTDTRQVTPELIAQAIAALGGGGGGGSSPVVETIAGGAWGTPGTWSAGTAVAVVTSTAAGAYIKEPAGTWSNGDTVRLLNAQANALQFNGNGTTWAQTSFPPTVLKGEIAEFVYYGGAWYWVSRGS